MFGLNGQHKQITKSKQNTRRTLATPVCIYICIATAIGGCPCRYRYRQVTASAAPACCRLVTASDAADHPHLAAPATSHSSYPSNAGIRTICNSHTTKYASPAPRNLHTLRHHDDMFCERLEHHSWGTSDLANSPPSCHASPRLWCPSSIQALPSPCRRTETTGISTEACATCCNPELRSRRHGREICRRI